MTSIAPERLRLPRFGRLGTAAAFVVLAVALLPAADFRISGHDPWAELARMGQGLLSPDFSAIGTLARAAALTVAFAICGVALGASTGFALAPLYRFAPVRLFCVAIRSIHELFWAILLLQITGLSVTTGILAIAIPYAGIFAKVFSEYLDEADPRPAAAMPPRADFISVHFFARLPLAAREFQVYLLYRLECGLRSSAVLGFVGLPTLGFELDTFFKQGMYGAVAAVLIIYYVLIATMRLWMRWPLAPFYLLASIGFMATLASPPMAPGALIRFVTSDIVPAPLRNGDLGDPETWVRFGDWLHMLLFQQALPGLTATMIVAQLALVVAGFVALIGFPLLVVPVVGRFGSALGHIGLVVGRSTPEYMLAYIALQIFGPSMLPAVIALGLHNGAIIAHLLGRQSAHVHENLRPDAPRGLVLYAYELLPRIYGSFLALCLYRWEIIVRESAIVGLLGIATLGFYVDRAIQEIRIDRAIVLLLVTMLATVAIDAISRRLRKAIGIDGLVSRRDQVPGATEARLA
ncbi:ABC transporter permease [Mesorhizobium microcysteis]|uniref:ABC transporter permease n=1 Tax=Neoaquamicrobium microcysteis TaxID=2682781 RepID=A0A5D4GV40_9HYPH|nr:ABC transporter permease [Mesorhizobium microcysteis]TYR32731.1 ABC transporter permease [Mesorhizobium microcysteis]